MTRRANTVAYILENYQNSTTQYTFQGIPLEGLSAQELRAILAYLVNCDSAREVVAYKERRDQLSRKWGTA